MGSTTTKSDFKRDEWERYQSDGRSQILAHRANHNTKIAEYNFKAGSPKEFKRANRLYDLRKNSSDIVATLFQDLRIEKGCSTTYSGHVYTEWIPITLENVVHVPFPDVLHIYHQALSGFQKLV